MDRLERLPSHRQRALVVLRARLHAATGNPDAARRLLADLPDSPDLARVVIHLALGDHERAFSELDRAVTQKTLGPYSWGNPELDPLRADPRFSRLLSRIGLPVDRVVALGRERG